MNNARQIDELSIPTVAIIALKQSVYVPVNNVDLILNIRVCLRISYLPNGFIGAIIIKYYIQLE